MTNRFHTGPDFSPSVRGLLPGNHTPMEASAFCGSLWSSPPEKGTENQSGSIPSSSPCHSQINPLSSPPESAVRSGFLPPHPLTLLSYHRPEESRFHPGNPARKFQIFLSHHPPESIIPGHPRQEIPPSVLLHLPLISEVPPQESSELPPWHFLLQSTGS